MGFLWVFKGYLTEIRPPDEHVEVDAPIHPEENVLQLVVKVGDRVAVVALVVPLVEPAGPEFTHKSWAILLLLF